MVKPFGDPKAAFLALALLFAFGMAAVQPTPAVDGAWTLVEPAFSCRGGHLLAGKRSGSWNRKVRGKCGLAKNRGTAL